MANNCLLTKLKGVVDNDNLDVLGSFYANIGRLDEIGSSDRNIIISTWNEQTHDTEQFDVVCKDNVKIEMGGTQYSQMHTSKCDGKIVASAIGDRSIMVTPKYPLTQVRLGALMGADLDSFKYCTELLYLGTPIRYEATYWTGDVKSLANVHKLINLYVNSPNVSWELEDLYHMTSLTGILFNATTCGPKGDWYDLVVANRNSGRTSGQIDSNSTFIYPFNGVSTTQYVPASSSTTLKWTSDKAFLKNANYVFEKGYSDEEIAANIAGTGTEDWSSISSDHVIKCD